MTQLGLESDIGNTNFQGATNPDAALHVQIYTLPIKNNYESEKQGRPIFEDATMIRIHTPGNQLNVIERPLTPADKARFPMHWAHWNNTHGKDGATIGTPLEQWPMITPSQAEMLKAVNFKTVDMIAMASDQQIQAIGMIGGMAPTSFRDRAKSFLRSAAGESATHELEEAVKAREKQIADMSEKHDREMAELRALILAKPERKKPGRKAKTEATA